jgi:hypothetical protein
LPCTGTKRLWLTKQQCIDALRSGDPHIEVYNGMGRELVRPTDPQPKQERAATDSPYVISITSNTLQPGDEKRVAKRLAEILKPAVERARKG